MELNDIYKNAARAAFADGVVEDSELVNWIRMNCKYRADTLMFLVLGIGSHLADLISQSHGFKNQVDEIWQTKIAPNWECDRFGKYTRK